MVLLDDLAPAAIGIREFKAFEEIKEELDSLLAEVESEPSLPGQSYILSKLRQSRFLINSKSSDVPLGRRTLEIQNLPLRELPEKYITEISQSIDWELAERDSYFSSVPHKDVADLMLNKSARWVAEAVRRFPFLKESDFDYHPERLEVMWINAIVTMGDRIKLVINTRDEIAYTEATIEYLVLHEICGHIIHFTSPMQNAELQTKAPHLLCLTIHSQDSFYVEGVAQLISELLARASDQDKKVQMLLRAEQLRHAVTYQNLARYCSRQRSVDEMVEYHESHYPGTSRLNPSNVRERYKSILESHFGFDVVAGYALSFDILSPLLDCSEEKQAEAVKKLVSWVRSPKEMEQIARRGRGY